MSSAVPWYCSSLWRLGQIAYRPFMRRLITCNSTSLVWNSHICLRSRNDHTMAQLTSAMALVCVKIDVATLWQSIVTSSSVSFSKIARWWSRGDKRTMSSARKLNTSTEESCEAAHCASNLSNFDSTNARTQMKPAKQGLLIERQIPTKQIYSHHNQCVTPCA